MTPAEDQFTHDLRLAREICLGLAAFVAVPDGTVWIDQLPDDRRPVQDGRIKMLARDSLSHPSARSGDLFWNAKVTTGTDTPDDSLACIAVGLVHEGVWLGILGVADAWLPDLDQEQRQSLSALARSLANALASDDDALGGAIDLVTSLPPDAAMVAVPTAPSPASPSSAPPASPTPSVSPEGFMGEVVDHLPDALVVAQDDGTIVFVNEQFSNLTGMSPDTILGGDAATLFSGDDPLSSSATWPEDIGSLFGSGAPGRRLSVISADKDHLAVDAWGTSFRSGLVGECHIGLIREAGLAAPTGTDALPIGRAVFDVLDALDEGILVCDHLGVVLMANRAARTLQGFGPTEELVGAPFPRTTKFQLPQGGPLAGSEHPLERALRGKVVPGDELLVEQGDGQARHILVSARPFMVEDGDQGALLVLRDITPQVESEAWLTHLAMHDSLTGLANRHLLIDHLRRMVAKTGTRGHVVSVVYLDVDGFKAINDNYGHGVGDEVLITMAQRVRAVVRPDDVVARLGGDEFVVAHSSLAESGSVDVLVARISECLAAPFQVRQHRLAVTASVGYVSTTSEDDPLALLVRADREMFRRKKAARSAAKDVPGR